MKSKTLTLEEAKKIDERMDKDKTVQKTVPLGKIVSKSIKIKKSTKNT